MHLNYHFYVVVGKLCVARRVTNTISLYKVETYVPIKATFKFLYLSGKSFVVINVYSFLYETNIQNRKYLYFKLLVLTTLTKQACI